MEDTVTIGLDKYQGLISDLKAKEEIIEKCKEEGLIQFKKVPVYMVESKTWYNSSYFDNIECEDVFDDGHSRLAFKSSLDEFEKSNWIEMKEDLKKFKYKWDERYSQKETQLIEEFEEKKRKLKPKGEYVAIPWFLFVISLIYIFTV